MKRLILAATAAVLALTCSPVLSGCAITASPTSTASTPSQTEAQALNDAEAGYTALAQTLDQAALSGLLKGQNAATAAKYLDLAHTALVALRAAYAAANATDFATQLSAFNAAVTAANSLAAPSS